MPPRYSLTVECDTLAEVQTALDRLAGGASSPAPDPPPVVPPVLPPFVPGAGVHDYFYALANLPGAIGFSLRNQEQLDSFLTHHPKISTSITYQPQSDAYPERQDAAKVVVDENFSSIKEHLEIPLDIRDGTAVFVWDGWWGREYLTGGIDGHKAFQILSSVGSGLCFEVRTLSFGAAGGTGHVDVRPYGPTAIPGGYLDSLQPMFDPLRFIIAPATWTRFIVEWESVTDGFDRWSMWVMDETRGPVQIYDRAQMNVPGDRIAGFWLEYNSSQEQRVGPPCVAYVRNFAVLRNLDPTPFLLRPVVG